MLSLVCDRTMFDDRLHVDHSWVFYGFIMYRFPYIDVCRACVLIVRVCVWICMETQEASFYYVALDDLWTKHSDSYTNKCLCIAHINTVFHFIRSIMMIWYKHSLISHIDCEQRTFHTYQMLNFPSCILQTLNTHFIVSQSHFLKWNKILPLLCYRVHRLYHFANILLWSCSKNSAEKNSLI